MSTSTPCLRQLRGKQHRYVLRVVVCTLCLTDASHPAISRYSSHTLTSSYTTIESRHSTKASSCCRPQTDADSCCLYIQPQAQEDVTNAQLNAANGRVDQYAAARRDSGVQASEVVMLRVLRLVISNSISVEQAAHVAMRSHACFRA